MPEKLDKGNKYKCSRCQQLVRAEKRLTIYEAVQLSLSLFLSLSYVVICCNITHAFVVLCCLLCRQSTAEYFDGSFEALSSGNVRQNQ